MRARPRNRGGKSARGGKLSKRLVARLVPAQLVIALGVFGPSHVQAQEDFRNLDEGRPSRVEDAYPIEYLEWEWELGAALQIAEAGQRGGGGVLELKTGIWHNLQVGIEAEGVWEGGGRTTESGLEAFGFHALYNLNQEGRSIPALAIRLDVATPGAGPAGRDRAELRLGALLTRTLGSVRLHLNGGRGWASTKDGGDVWAGGVAVDQALGLTSRTVVVGLYTEAPDHSGARLWADVGMRLQLTKTTVLDFGLTSLMDRTLDGDLNLGFVVGLSRSFGFGGWMRVPPYPEPRIS